MKIHTSVYTFYRAFLFGALSNTLFVAGVMPDCYSEPLSSTQSFSASTVTSSLAWLQCPNGSVFLAEGNEGQDNNLYSFNCTTGFVTLVRSFSPGSATRSLAWLQCPNGNVFLAEGNEGQDNNLYSFNCATGVVTLLRSFSPGSATRALAWLQCPNGNVFLAEGNIGGPGVPNFLYSFDCATNLLTQIQTFDASFSVALSLSWLTCPDGSVFLAEGNSGSNRLFGFDCSGTLTQVQSFSPGSVGTNSLSWLTCHGNVFLASSFPGNNQLYNFSCDTGQLNTSGAQSFSSSGISTSLAWLTCADGRVFLAEGNKVASKLYQFDCYTGLVNTTPIQTFAVGASITSLAWLSCDNGNTFLVAGNNSGANTIFSADCLMCFEKSNQVSDCYQEILDTPQSFSSANSTTSLAWLTCNGKAFLAEGNGGQSKTYMFDCTTGLLTEIFPRLSSLSTSTQSLAWLQCANGKIFLAQGNYNQDNTIYLFDCASEVFSVTQSFAPSLSTCSLAWVQCPNGNVFLAEGNDGQANNLYAFNCSTGTLGAPVPFPSSASTTATYCLTWLLCGNRVFLAEGNFSSDVNNLYSFNCATGTLGTPQPFPSIKNGFTKSLAWLTCPNGNVFLAEGNFYEKNKLYSFNCATGTLSSPQLFPVAGTASFTNTLSWMICSDGRIFLAEGNYGTGNGSATPLVNNNNIYTFDCVTGTLSSPQAVALPSRKSTYSLAWFQCDNDTTFLAEGNNPGPNQLFPAPCLRCVKTPSGPRYRMGTNTCSIVSHRG